MSLAQFAVHCTLYLDDDIATNLYTLAHLRFQHGSWEEPRVVYERGSVFYCLLYKRSYALAHGLVQYFAPTHHRRQREKLYDGAFVTVVARSFSYNPSGDPYFTTDDRAE
ncbi:hypothetical protein Hanom_Chr17g01542961 [Helianthus anomalus]